MEQEIAGKTIRTWTEEVPVLTQIIHMDEVFWLNPELRPFESASNTSSLGMKDIKDASDRLERFAPYFMKAFPETKATNGILESELREIPGMKAVLEKSGKIPGRLMLKMDSHLPISGSVKARGGIYEVLAFAEKTALEANLLNPGTSYAAFAEEPFRSLFQTYSVAVGSTGNLGLSIGIISAELGFHVTVHMSQDAQQWKKDLLRKKGVTVVEHSDDYTQAVTAGRERSRQDRFCHFVDDENSPTLFLGYSVSALRLKKQLEEAKIPVDQEHPLFVYLPCGVGGGPGGICFGIKQVFGDAAHCFFAEPTHAPSMLLGLCTGCHDQVSVKDFGIDNHTVADGLAVGRPSRFVGRLIQPFLSGMQTIQDARMFQLLYQLSESEGIFLEPSALAGMSGPLNLTHSEAGREYLQMHGLTEAIKNGTHIVWATGGAMVPSTVMQQYLAIGRSI